MRRRLNDKQRVAIWGCVGDRFSAYIGAATRPVFNHELLPQLVTQLFRVQPADGIGGAAGWVRDNYFHRPVGIVALRMYRTKTRQK